MASGYQHGVYSGEVPTALLPARYVDTNAVFAVGTAPVHTLGEEKTRYINKPRLYNSYDAFVSEMGWSEDWHAYTLCEMAESHFAKFGASPLVCVNVFDPEKHVAEADGAPDASLVTSADIIGGIDPVSSRKTVLELVAEVFPRFRIVPGSILAPRFSEDPAVAVSMGAKSKGINSIEQAPAPENRGNFRAGNERTHHGGRGGFHGDGRGHGTRPGSPDHRNVHVRPALQCPVFGHTQHAFCRL